jgi:hypothetical protein
MKTTGCLACEGTYRDKRLQPFCSIVCRTLGQAGMGWRLNPYRIVDLETGMVLTTGPRFDLTPRGLEYLHSLADRLRQTLTPDNSIPQTIRPTPDAAFMGSYIGKAA